jgi:hypothetical protein
LFVYDPPLEVIEVLHLKRRFNCAIHFFRLCANDDIRRFRPKEVYGNTLFASDLVGTFGFLQMTI